jgi:hypothetical protein
MDPITQQTVLAAAGAASGDPVYVDDVFSTYVYEGTGSALSINNGIDLSGEGGLVWIKNRESSFQDHAIYDTERGAGQTLNSATTYGQFLSTGRFSAFNSNGFTVGTDNGTNQSGNGMVSWSFRKAPGFFDVVTYNGQSNGGTFDTWITVPHNLGSTPGMVIIKCTSNEESWLVWHRSLPTSLGNLNYTNEFVPSNYDTFFGHSSGAADANNIYVRAGQFASGYQGYTYVAYVFAHDDASFGTDGDESIIKCGSYTGTNTGGLQTVNVGFEPQFVLIKNTTTTADWHIIDAMRGAADNGIDQALLAANQVSAENSSGLRLFVTNNGFGWRDQTGSNISGAGNTFIYMAIRRPHKPPEAGTDVFHAYYGTPASNSTITTGFPYDMQIAKEASSANSHYLFTRKLGLNTWDTTDSYTRTLQPSVTSAAQSGNLSRSVGNTGFGMATAYANNLMIFHSFKRAPGFFDVVDYTGTVTGNSDSQTVTHNLGVTPELMLVKRRSGPADWYVYSNALTTPLTQKLVINDAGGESSTSNAWGTSSSPTAPNANNFTVGYATETGWVTAGTFIAYLFATLPGISKVGSYTGTGSAINVDCGFIAGARFILIKRTDSTGDWYVWDTARGIVSGNDPYYKLNVGAAQVTNTDYIDPLSTGFTVTSSAPAALNASGGTYIFLAIA